LAEVLEKCQGALAVALRTGKEIPIQRSLQMTEAIITEVVAVLHQLAAEENWPESGKAKRLQDIQAPADHLIEAARGELVDTAIADWVAKVHSLALEAARHTTEVLKEKSTD
jgi:hypothetical protein